MKGCETHGYYPCRMCGYGPVNLKWGGERQKPDLIKRLKEVEHYCGHHALADTSDYDTGDVIREAIAEIQFLRFAVDTMIAERSLHKEEQ